jgi:hypothetical protein
MMFLIMKFNTINEYKPLNGSNDWHRAALPTKPRQGLSQRPPLLGYYAD